MGLPVLNVQTFKLNFPHNNLTIKYRPMRLSEEKMIILANESEDELEKIEAVIQVAEACIIEGPKAETLNTFEIEYLFIHIFKKSKDSDIKMVYICPELSCVDEETKKGFKTNFSISLDQVKLKYDETHSNDIILSDDVGIIFKYPTFDMARSIQKEGKNIEDSIDALIELVDTIYDKDTTYDFRTETKEDQRAFFNQLTISQFTKVGDFLKSMPKVVADAKPKCAKCLKGRDLPIEGLLSFLA